METDIIYYSLKMEMYLVGVVTNLGNLEEILKKMEITNLLENNYTKI